MPIRKLVRKSRAKTVPVPESEPRSTRRTWQLQTAKAHFSEVFRRTRAEGPQLITRQGKEGVVMIPVEQFDRLVHRSQQPKSLAQFFRASPLAGLKLDFDRDRDEGRDVEL